MMNVQREIIVFDMDEQRSILWYEIINDDGELIYVREQLKNERQWDRYFNSPQVGLLKERPGSGLPPRLGHSDSYYENSLTQPGANSSDA